MLGEPLTSKRPARLLDKHRTIIHPWPEIAVYGKIQPHDFLSYVFYSDVLGAVALSLGIFRFYALPLQYDYTQLWLGLGGFAGAWVASAYTQDLYGRRALSASLRRLLPRAMATVASAFGILLLLGFAMNVIGGVSRVWLLTWAGSVFVWIGLTRVVWRAWMRSLIARGHCLERALVLAGSVQQARDIADTIVDESKGQIRIAAAVAIPGNLNAPSLEWLEAAVRGGIVDRVIVGGFSAAMTHTNALLARLTRMAIDVTLLPDLDGLQAPVLSVDRIGQLAAVDLHYRPLSALQSRLKRVEDLAIAGLLVLFVLPLLAVVSVAIKLDSRGPVLFRQERAGFHDRTFKVWKFRTMHAHASDHAAAVQTSRGDSRVTRVGRFLRRTSIDELPQLFNVLTGEMSIVGPRPHALGMTAVGLPLHEVIEEYSARHRLKPGITGWAQVNGCRGEVDSQDKLRRRVALDCYYIENWSLAFDFWIIVRTATMLMANNDAY